MSSPHQSVPPHESSHTSNGDPNAPVRVIRISRLGLLGVGILLFCVSFPALSWPAVLGWLFVVPVVVAVWILRTQTTVTKAGLDTRTLLGSDHLDWSRIRGVRFPKRGWARAELADGDEAVLPAVGFDRLRELAAASGGRIPDPYDSTPPEGS